MAFYLEVLKESLMDERRDNGGPVGTLLAKEEFHHDDTTGRLCPAVHFCAYIYFVTFQIQRDGVFVAFDRYCRGATVLLCYFGTQTTVLQ